MEGQDIEEVLLGRDPEFWKMIESRRRKWAMRKTRCDKILANDWVLRVVLRPFMAGWLSVAFSPRALPWADGLSPLRGFSALRGGPHSVIRACA